MGDAIVLGRVCIFKGATVPEMKCQCSALRVLKIEFFLSPGPLHTYVASSNGLYNCHGL